MKEIVKRLLKRFGPPFLFYKKSYAQEGEDLVVNRLLEGKKDGFYVDVGAHHPYRFSNTYFFIKEVGLVSLLIHCQEQKKRLINLDRRILLWS